MWYTQHSSQTQHAQQLTRRAQKAQQGYLAQIAQHCSHALTLQTTLPTHNVSAERMEQNLEQARRSTHQLRLRSNRALTGNGWQRNSRYLPIFVPVIEGSLNTYDKHKTLHIHLAVGNLPKRYAERDLLGIYRGCWLSTAFAADDVVLVPMRSGRESGWFSYLTKEERLGRTDCVDYHNSQIPEHIVATL
jgi:hypothetical protein